MKISEFIPFDNVLIDEVSQSKKSVLLKISELLASCQENLDKCQLFDAFWQRETLGSTALGHGVALPHIRISDIDKIYGCFLRLHYPVDFGAEDKQPTDLVLGLIVPENQPEDHLIVLKELMQRFSVQSFRQACRHAENNKGLYALLTQSGN